MKNCSNGFWIIKHNRQKRFGFVILYRKSLKSARDHPVPIESRAFVFGKMKNEGVPLVWATVVSAFFFSYLHATNPGFGILPLLSIFIVGILYALSYHYFGTIWFTCTAHMMWNFAQDFIFGLPDSFINAFSHKKKF